MATDREIIHNWRIAKQRLDRAKKDEMRWRMLIAMQLFPEVELGTNWYKDEVKLIAKENYTLDKDRDKVSAVWSKVLAECPDDAANLAILIDWSMSLNKAVYEAMSEKAQSIFAAVLTIKEATPAVSLGSDKE